MVICLTALTACGEPPAAPLIDAAPNFVFEIPPPCAECEGGVTELTLVNNGPGTQIVVTAGHEEIFSGYVAAGQTFTLYGTKKDGRLGNEITVYADGNETNIRVNCSMPIGPGSVFGDFEVAEAFSKGGGRICEAGEEGLCEFGRPRVLYLEYTGDDCSASDHLQDPESVSCTDFDVLTSPVRVIVSDREDPGSGRSTSWYNGTVSLGGIIVADAAGSGEYRLGPNTWVNIFDSDESLLQSVSFHTSCSQPLEPGDQFGSILLLDFDR